MIFYAAIGLVLFFLGFLRLLGVIDRSFERPLVLCITVLAFALSWMRWKTGTDWELYTAFFHTLTSISVARSQDWWGPAYAYTAVFVNSIGGGYSEFLFVIAAALYSSLYYFITRGSAAPLIAVFILFCTNFFSIYFVRQDVAVAFFLGFLYFYFQNRYVAAVAMAVAAIAAHISAVVPICLVIFVVNFTWKKFCIGLASAVCAAYFVFRDLAWATLLKLLPALGYFDSGFVEVKESDLSTTSRAYLKLCFLIVILLVAQFRFQGRTRDSVAPDWYDFCRKSAIVILLMTACFLPLSQIVARFTMYAMPLVALSLSNYEFRFRQISFNSAVYVGFLLMFFVELDALYNGYAKLYFPVRTILTR